MSVTIQKSQERYCAKMRQVSLLLRRPRKAAPDGWRKLAYRLSPFIHSFR